MPRDDALVAARRTSELATACSSSLLDTCDMSNLDGVMYAEIDIRHITIVQAQANIYVTLFVVGMLLLGAWSFAKVSQRL